MNNESRPMTFDSACPQAQELEALMLGSLPSESADLLVEHLATCEQCLTTIQGLGEDDTFAAALRQSPLVYDSIPKGEVVDRLIERVRTLKTDLSAGASSTVNLSKTSLGTQTDNFSTSTEEVYSFLRPPAAPGELGQLGPYRVLRVLGAGGMGVVFAALDPQLERMIALKVIRPDLAVGESDRNRFLREARAHAAVRHDHIVTVYQVGEDQGVSFLAIEYLEGETLDARLKRNPLPLKLTLRIGREIALGLAAAHAKGVVHRDIKPGNIWLEADGNRVKILDFGLARPQKDPHTITQSGAMIGTPAFMSPEQVQGDEVDFRSDLFSLGCVLYRMATGVFPFQGKSVASVLVAVTDKEPTAPSKINPHIPPDFSRLILRLLSKKPADRLGSAATVAKFLAELEQQRPLRQPATTVARKARPKTPALQPRRSWRPPGKLIVIACLLAVIGITGYFAKTLVRIATNTGELVIQIGDPSIEVVVKQPDGAVVVDRTTQRNFVLKATEGQDGEIEFYEPDSGVHLTTKKFRLERGGVEIVSATIDRESIQKPMPPIDPPVVPDSKLPTQSLSKPVQISEPPELDAWLKGRTILTVAQDGSGQFKSIQAALTAMQPGQVVKVLDKGPYRESLDLPVVPEDCGLISELQTEITCAKFARQFGDARLGHFFGPMEGLRIHGFRFNITSKPEEHFGVLFRDPSGLLLEDCYFQVDGPDTEEAHAFVCQWLDQEAQKPAWIRNCLLLGRFSLLSSPAGRGIAVIEHNFIDGPGNQCIWSTGDFRSIVIRHNILGGNVVHADLAFENLKTTEALELSNNTSFSSRPFVFAGSIPTGNVTICNNLHTHAGIVGVVTDQGAKQVRDIWQVSHNAYLREPQHGEFGYPRPVFFPRLPHDVLAAPKFMANDAVDPNFLRIPLDSPQATGGAGGGWPSYIGALAPGPARKEGDWFTRLRERWPFTLKISARGPIKAIGAADVPSTDPTLDSEWSVSIAMTSRSQASPSKGLTRTSPPFITNH